MAKRKEKYNVIIEKEDEDDPWGNDGTGEYPTIGFIRVNGGSRILCRRTGGARCKYLGKKYVVKLDDKYRQTRLEIDRYINEISPADKKYFPKLLGYDKVNYEYLIQERIKFKRVSTRNGKVNRAVHKHAIRIIERLCEKYYLRRDINPEYPRNWGIRENGQPVIFDFGF